MPHLQTLRLVSLSLALLFQLFRASVARELIGLGCLADFSTPSGLQIASAVKLAVEHVNSNGSILPKYKLAVSILDSGTSSFPAQAAALKLFAGGVVAILGPPFSSQVHAAAPLASTFQVPVIGYSASESSLSSRSQIPLFCRLSQNDKQQMSAVADLIRIYNFRQVVAIFSDDDYGRNGIDQLKSQLAPQDGYEVIRSIALDPAGSINVSDVQLALKPLGAVELAVFVVHAQSQLASPIFLAAHAMGMTTQGYVWIATEDTMREISGTQAGSALREATQGVIGVRTFIPLNPRLRALVPQWVALDRQTHPGAGTLPIDAYTLFAYDSVWLAARAINATLEAKAQEEALKWDTTQNSNPVNSGITVQPSFNFTAYQSDSGPADLQRLLVNRDGRLLFQNIKSQTFDGVSGRISLSTSCDLQGLSVEVINMVNGTSVRLGFWTTQLGFTRTLPQQNMSSDPAPNSPLGFPVDPSAAPSAYSPLNTSTAFLSRPIWPGNTLQVPRGWLPYNGKVLRIAFANPLPFAPGVNVSGGFVLPIFQEAMARLPYPIRYELVDFGDGTQDISYTGMIRTVSTGDFDAAVGDITITSLRSKVVDFTYPFAESGLCLVVLAGVSAPVDRWVFLAPFTLSVWLCLFCAILATAFFLWYLERYQNEELEGTKYEQAETSLWISFTTLGFASEIPIRTVLGRFVFIFWNFSVLIIVSSYTANLTSLLTSQQLMPSLTTLAAFISSKAKMGYREGSFTPQALLTLGINPAQLVPLLDFADFASALDSGRVSGVVEEWQAVRIFIEQYGNRFTIVQKSFTLSDWGFAFKKGSMLAMDVSASLAKMVEGGEVTRIQKAWLQSANIAVYNPMPDPAPGNQQGVDSYLYLFLIYFGFLLLFMLLYSLRSWYLHRRGDDNTSSGAQCARFKLLCIQEPSTLEEIRQNESEGDFSPAKRAGSLFY